MSAAPAAALRSAVIVAVPAAAAAVDGWRERTCRDRPSTGVPPHVTVVFPFAPAAVVDAELVEELGRVVREVGAFGFVLRSLRRFPEVLYLAPEPVEPFVRLTEAVVARFPAWPPYEGVFDSIVPHLTVACGDAGVLARAEADVAPSLPIEVEASEVVLLEELEPDWGRWAPRARLALGRSSGLGTNRH